MSCTLHCCSQCWSSLVNASKRKSSNIHQACYKKRQPIMNLHLGHVGVTVVEDKRRANISCFTLVSPGILGETLYLWVKHGETKFYLSLGAMAKRRKVKMFEFEIKTKIERLSTYKCKYIPITESIEVKIRKKFKKVHYIK